MRTVYDNTSLDQELFVHDVISPFVAQFPGLVSADIVSTIDPATNKTISRDFEIINDYGDIVFTYPLDGVSTTELAYIAMHGIKILRGDLPKYAV